MKKFISKQKNCLTSLLCLVVICEILLKIDNVIIQTIGILILPIIVLLVITLMINDQKDLQKKGN